MKKYMLLHFGFEKPIQEIMKAWQAWLESIADKQVAQGGSANGLKISRSGSRNLPWDKDSITGHNIIEAESLEAAQRLASSNPFVSGIRVDELR